MVPTRDRPWRFLVNLTPSLVIVRGVLRPHPRVGTGGQTKEGLESADRPPDDTHTLGEGRIVDTEEGCRAVGEWTALCAQTSRSSTR